MQPRALFRHLNLQKWSDFEVKMLKNTGGSDHFWRFRCRFVWQAQRILHLVKSEQRVGGLKHFQRQPPLHHTTLQYITLHYNYNYNYTFTTFYYTPLHYTALNYTQLHYITRHYTTLHYTLHYTSLHYTTLHYLPLHFTTLHYTTLHNTTTTTAQLHSNFEADPINKLKPLYLKKNKTFRGPRNKHPGVN